MKHTSLIILLITFALSGVVRAGDKSPLEEILAEGEGFGEHDKSQIGASVDDLLKSIEDRSSNFRRYAIAREQLIEAFSRRIITKELADRFMHAWTLLHENKDTIDKETQTLLKNYFLVFEPNMLTSKPPLFILPNPPSNLVEARLLIKGILLNKEVSKDPNTAFNIKMRALAAFGLIGSKLNLKKLLIGILEAPEPFKRLNLTQLKKVKRATIKLLLQLEFKEALQELNRSGSLPADTESLLDEFPILDDYGRRPSETTGTYCSYKSALEEEIERLMGVTTQTLPAI